MRPWRRRCSTTPVPQSISENEKLIGVEAKQEDVLLSHLTTPSRLASSTASPGMPRSTRRSPTQSLTIDESEKERRKLIIIEKTKATEKAENSNTGAGEAVENNKFETNQTKPNNPNQPP